MRGRAAIYLAALLLASTIPLTQALGGELQLRSGPANVVRLAVLAVEFPEVKHTRPLSELEATFFGSSNSVAAYFSWVSFGSVKITGEVFGWLALNESFTYYAADGAVLGDDRLHGPPVKLAEDAIKAFDPHVDFSKFDAVAVVFAGYGQETVWKAGMDTIWTRTVNVTNLAPDGKEIEKVSLLAELERGYGTLGIYCHELMHLILGIEDLYVPPEHGWEVGKWDLMAFGMWNGEGNMPAGLTSYMLIDAGLLPPEKLVEVTEPNSEVVIALNPLYSPRAPSVLKMGSPDHYFLVEIRSAESFDAGLPSHGPLVLEVKPGGALPFTVVDSTPGSKYWFYDVDDAAFSNVTEYVNRDAQISLQFRELGNGSVLVRAVWGSACTLKVVTRSRQGEALSGVEVAVDGFVNPTNASGIAKFFVLPGRHTVEVVTGEGAGTRLRLVEWQGGVTTARRTIEVLPGLDELTLTAELTVEQLVKFIVLSAEGTAPGSLTPTLEEPDLVVLRGGPEARELVVRGGQGWLEYGVYNVTEVRWKGASALIAPLTVTVPRDGPLVFAQFGPALTPVDDPRGVKVVRVSVLTYDGNPFNDTVALTLKASGWPEVEVTVNGTVRVCAPEGLVEVVKAVYRNFDLTPTAKVAARDGEIEVTLGIYRVRIKLVDEFGGGVQEPVVIEIPATGQVLEGRGEVEAYAPAGATLIVSASFLFLPVSVQVLVNRPFELSVAVPKYAAYAMLILLLAVAIVAVALFKLLRRSRRGLHS